MKKYLKLWIIGLTVVLFSASAAVCEENPVKKVRDALDEMGVSFYGKIDVDAAYQDTDTSDTSDITLSTVELGIDIKPIKHVSGHIVFLYEEDATDLEIDQGYIRLDGEDKCPFYAEAGRLYVPFGRFESHFITDPVTQTLGETRETALVLGYANKQFEVAASIFNGEVNEASENNDMIDGYTVSAVINMPTSRGLSLSAGLSYLSNLGDGDSINAQLTTSNTLTSYVPAAAAFISADLNEKYFCKIEYVEAIDHFVAGNLAFNSGRNVEPKALNVELAYALTDRFEIGLRYGATDDAGTFLPETLFGVVANYSPIDHLGISLEYQTGEYEDNSDITTATLRLALDF